MNQKITLIAAVADNGCIGGDNQMLWHIPEDFAFFKQYTMGKPVVMGRKTWESLPKKPLPGRRNIVVSRNACRQPENGAEWTDSIQSALALCAGDGEVVFIGGAQIYAQVLPLATDLRLTRVHLTVSGDAFFPTLPEAWHEVSRSSHVCAKNGTAFDFVHYTR